MQPHYVCGWACAAPLDPADASYNIFIDYCTDEAGPGTFTVGVDGLGRFLLKASAETAALTDAPGYNDGAWHHLAVSYSVSGSSSSSSSRKV